MTSLNRATLIGNVGRDPEIRSTADGRRIGNLSLATSESWKDKNSGEKRERVDWHRVVIFPEHLVSLVERYVRKGSRVMVEGSVETRKWQDQSGTDRYSTEIVLRPFNSQILLLDKPPERTEPVNDPGRQGPIGGPDLDDEIPFAPLRELV